MGNFELSQFMMLLKREYWEHRGLFVIAPLVVALILLVASFWASRFAGPEMVTEVLRQFGTLTSGLTATQLGPLMMPLAVPFISVLYVCVLVYLVNCLYQDRRDASILFWQSMPVSNLKTVMSKIVMVCAVAPLIMIAVIFGLLVITALAIVINSTRMGVETIGFGQMLGGSIYGLLLVYMSTLLAGLWLFSTLGWLLLFSAFARALPFLSAIAVFILLLFLEDFIFGTQYLTTWLDSRAVFTEYIVFAPGDFFAKLFSYDMLAGIVAGAVLVTGAVYMRRFAD
jgi:ABC-2 type transport system permease protein